MGAKAGGFDTLPEFTCIDLLAVQFQGLGENQ